MSNFFTQFLADRFLQPQVERQVAAVLKNDPNRSFAYGVVATDTRDTRQLVGQNYTIDHYLLYAIYKLNADVFGCVQKWMGGVTTTDWHVEPIDPDNASKSDLKQAEDLTAVLKGSNPFQKYTELLKETVMHMGISGDAYWYKIPKGNGPEIAEIWGLHPALMKILSTVHGEILGYVMRAPNAAEPVVFEPHEVIHFRLPNPTHDLYGLSPLEILVPEVQTDLHMQRANQAYFDNDMTPDSILMLDDNLSDEEAKKAKRMIAEKHQGSDKKHKMMVARGVKDIKILGSTMKDAEFLAGRDLTTKKVTAAYEVPEVLLGYHNRGDYATSDVMERIFYNTKIRPLQKQMEESISDELIFPINPRLRFSFDSLDFTDQDGKRKDYLQATSLGILTKDEVRAEIFDLPPLKEIDPRLDGTGPTASLATDGHGDDSKDANGNSLNDETSQKSVRKADDASLADERDAQLRDLSDELEPAIVSYFTDQQTNLAQPPRAADDLDGWLDSSLETATAALVMVFAFHLYTSLFAGTQAAQTQLNLVLPFEKINAYVQDYLSNDALTHAAGITATTRDQLRSSLSEGIASGESQTQLAARVQAVYANASANRAKQIAGSETAQAFQYANHAAAEATELALTRTFLTSNDERVCPICSPLDGVTVAFDAPYPGGVEPGSDHVLCRCTETYEAINA